MTDHARTQPPSRSGRAARAETPEQSLWAPPSTSEQPTPPPPAGHPPLQPNYPPPTVVYAYPPPAPAAAPAARARTNGLGIAALVLSILWIWGLGSLLAVIFGFVAMGQIDRSNGTQNGRGLALAGAIVGMVGLVGAAILIIAVLAASGDDSLYTTSAIGGIV